MPRKRRLNANGETVYVRPKFDPADYTMSPDVIETIKSWSYMSFDDLMEDHEGPLKGRWYVIDRYERDGKRWLVVQHVKKEWCLEVEDSGRPIREIELRAVPPERAWDLALAEDTRLGLIVEREGW